MELPRVALVGRPNVGKSTLFNRFIGKRLAVVAPVAGTTRDRLEREVTWKQRQFVLTDMAGLEPALAEQNEISQGMQRQVQAGLDSADLIMWVVDGSEGATPADRLIAELLRRLGKPVVVAVNKCDHTKHDIAQHEFAEYGFAPLVPISAMHDRGVDQLLDALIAALPSGGSATQNNDRELVLAITGRPNVGKSTLLNALVGEERSVVSAVAGTTRDAIDTVLSATELFGRTFTQWQHIRIVDTAGIRRRGKIDREVEGWSVVRTYDAIDAAEVTLALIDGLEGLVHQDTQVLERIVNAGKPVVLVVNKWDAVLEKPGAQDDETEQTKFLDMLRRKLPFMHWAQVIFVSAKTGLNLDLLGRLILNAWQAWNREIGQAELDELTKEIKKMPRIANLLKITYEHGRPPVFHLHTEGKKLPHFSTRRFVENALRDHFELGPTPIKIWVQRSGIKDVD